MPKRKMPDMKKATAHLVALTKEKEQIFYNALEEGKTIDETCDLVDISRKTYDNHGKRKPEFIIKCKTIINRNKLEKAKTKPRTIIIKEDNKKDHGRPTLMTLDVINKLEEAFSKGLNITHACIFANISRETFYNYCQRTTGFLDKCNSLQQQPSIKAKILINEAIDGGDVNTAKWYVERKCKDEFSLKTETEHSGEIKSKVVYIEKEEKEAYEQHINKIIEDAD